MRELNADGYFDVRFSKDRIQAFVDIYPPQGGGRNVSAAEIVAALQNRGVAYGIHAEAIENAARQVASSAVAIHGILAAQGYLPVNGTDAQVAWRIDPALASQPLPLRADGLPDYLRFDPARMVSAGQELATVIPGLPGSPGKTLFAPFEAVPQTPGREAPILAGQGIRVEGNRARFVAEHTGFVELHNERLSVRALSLVEGDIAGGDHVYPGGLIVLGGVDGATVTARGPVAIRGTVQDASIRAAGETFISEAWRSLIVSDAGINLSGTVSDCEVMTPFRIHAVEGTKVAGGALIAAEGIDAFDLGSEAWSPTDAVLGSAAYAALRLRELDSEIHVGEKNAERIGAVLKPLTSIMAEPISAEKRKLVQALMDQKRELEQHIGHLHAEKRARQMAHYADTGAIRVMGRVFPGVRIDAYGARFDVEQCESEVEFHREAGGRHVVCTRLRSRAA